MSDYKPGSAYNEGFQSRMKGISRETFNNENPVYIQEWMAGWDDAHSKIIEASGCPWDTSPKTIDEFLEVCEMKSKWEKDNNAKIPPFWNCILSHSLFEEMAREIKEIRDAKRNP